MNTKNILQFFFSIVLLIFYATLSPAQENTHIITINLYGEAPRSYVFITNPDSLSLIPTFPVEDLINENSIEKIESQYDHRYKYFLVNYNTGNETNVLRLRYLVFQSVLDAEYYLISQLQISSISYNKIDEIGDNCWNAYNNYRVLFIRNNVFIDVKSVSRDSIVGVYQIAQMIDDLLNSTQKTTEISEIPFPQIHSIEIEQDDGRIITFNVDATDPLGTPLTYSCMWGEISEEPQVRYVKRTDENPETNNRVKFFIWNDAQQVASYNYF